MRKEISIFLIFVILTTIITVKTMTYIWDSSAETNPEIVTHKTHQTGKLTETGWRPEIYFVQTNEQVYIVPKEVYYNSKIGDVYNG